MKKIFLTFSVFMSFLSVSQAANATDGCAPYKLKASYSNENKKFEDLLKKDWDQKMKDYPEWASDLGHKQYAGLWTDSSLESIELREKQLQCLFDITKKINRKKLSSKNQLNYDLFRNGLEIYVDGLKFDEHYLVLNQLDGAHSSIVDTLTYMPEATPEDIENKLKRLESASTRLQQHKILLQEGLKKGVTAPQAVLGKIPAQFDPIITAKVTDSVLYKNFANLKNFTPEQVADFQKRAQLILEKNLLPAMKDYRDFVVNTYIPQARKTISAHDLPNGKEWYQWSVRYFTTTDKSADEIHEVGLKEVQRILNEMNAIREKVGFKKDLKAFNEHLKSDSKFFYSKPEDLLMGYRDIAKRADAELPKLFGNLPRMTYGVREIPEFKAHAAPMAYYSSGSVETGRAGYFEANTSNLKARPKWGMEALTLHEAVPGHHFQIAISQELGDLPEFRKYGHYTAYVEGWGLYAESLGDRMGFYQDPYSRYGQLSYEMWRAIRLVVDTGLHAKGWTRDQALKFFRENMAISDHDSEVETDRYIVWPGQALAYKIGQMKILELRQSAEKKLGTKFDIRKFHDVVLSGGALPLNVLENRVNEWTTKQ